MRIKHGIYTFEIKVEGSVTKLRAEDLGGRIVAESSGADVHAASADMQNRTEIEGLRLTLQGFLFPEELDEPDEPDEPALTNS